AAGGGEPEDAEYLEEIVRAIIERNHGAALAAVAGAMQQGRDAQTYAQDIVRVMRDCFLAMMSPELVQLPAQRVEELKMYARDLGAQRIVRVMETLGSTMVEMRHAPDARLLLEVAIVQLSSPSFDDSTENLLARISQLEETVKKLKETGVSAALPPPPVNPATGKAKIGGRIATAGTPRPAATPEPTGEIPTNSTNSPSSPAESVASEASAKDPTAETVAQPTESDPIQMWPQVTDTMKGLAKAMFKPAIAESFDGKVLTIKLPANTPVKRAQDQTSAVVTAVKSVCGLTCVVKFTQADPTGGIERPVIDDTPKTIDKIVAEDPFAEVDLAETVPVENALDPMLEALQNSFPQGSLIDDDSSSSK
ncbi:MAG: polymerase gamma/tau subunit, partial [Actinomycetota bacterium]